MKRVFNVLLKTASMLFQGGLLGGKVTPQGRIVQFLFALLVALLILIRFQAEELECSQSPDNILATSNWKVVSSTIPTNLDWEHTLTLNDVLLAASDKTVVFYRGGVSAGCGNQIIALDNVTGEVEWRFSAQLVRKIISIPDGYLLAKCCTSIIRLDASGAKVWESETFPTKISDPKLVVVDDKVYFVSDLQTYQIALNGGSLTQVIEGQQPEEAFWLTQLIHPVQTSNYRAYVASEDVLITARLYDQLFAYQIPTGEMLWETKQSFVAEPVIAGNMLITYDSQNVIHLTDIHRGSEVGNITLQRVQETPSNQRFLLAAISDRIFIRFYETSELLALDFAYP